jgi:hypothetical protein
MSEMFSGISIIPPAIIMSILVMFSPVAMEPAIKSGKSWDDCRDLIGVGHVVIGLPLIEVVNPCFIYGFIGKLVTFSSALWIRVWILARSCQIEGSRGEQGGG